jgi:hypothetical protein
MAKVAVIGCGGTGTYLVPILLRSVSKASSIVLFDGDAFTTKNLDRQLFRPDLVGINKAKAMMVMYPDKRMTAKHDYLRDSEELEDFDLVIACPDNHLARSRVLSAADEFEIPVVICGNEYNSSSAMMYMPEWKGTPMDPRIRYPEILTDRAGSPVDVSCTGEAVEDSPQLALANNTSAVFAIQLIHFWFNVVDEELSKDEDAKKKFPVEMSWVPSKLATLTVESVTLDYEYYQKLKEDKEKDGHEITREGGTGDSPTTT